MQNALEVVGLLAGIVAATVWAGPLVFKLGGSAINAWRFCAPVTLFVQWALRAITARSQSIYELNG